MSTGVYIRVSSPKGQKTDSQHAELEAWLKRHRYKAAQWFEDHESATTMNREAFQRLQAAIFTGEITTVVIWKLDRLARNLKEGVNVLADWCQGEGDRGHAADRPQRHGGAPHRQSAVWYCRD